MSTPKQPPFEKALRAGIRVSWASVAWTITSSSAAIVAGLLARNLVLVVFGLTGLLDAAGSVTLALHFRHALRNEQLSETRERVALRIVSSGLIAIGLYTIVESIRRLIVSPPMRDSTFGAVIAAGSILALGILALRKRAIARRVRSNALLADGWLSATGAGLAAIALLGTILSARSGLHWVDPVSALLVALVASGAGVSALRREAAELDAV